MSEGNASKIEATFGPRREVAYGALFLLGPPGGTVPYGEFGEFVVELPAEARADVETGGTRRAGGSAGTRSRARWDQTYVLWPEQDAVCAKHYLIGLILVNIC